jgi:hypothetical protein
VLAAEALARWSARGGDGAGTSLRAGAAAGGRCIRWPKNRRGRRMAACRAGLPNRLGRR